MRDPDRALAVCMFCGDDITRNAEGVYALGKYGTTGYACADCVTEMDGFELAAQMEADAIGDAADRAWDIWSQEAIPA